MPPLPPQNGVSHRLRRRQALRLSAAAGALLTHALTHARPRRGAAGAPAATPVREHLPNGLIVIAEERRSAETVALQLAARAGSRDDGAAPGINTLTSRVMFQGTSRRPSETELLRAAARVGGTLTRGTTAELSLFASAMPARAVDVGFDLLADVVLNPLFDEAALARQQQLALQELAQRRSDPGALLADLFQAAMFAGHPASTPPLGTAESVAALTRDALLANHARFWGAANLVLTIAGRLAPAEALAKAQSSFGALPMGAPAERRPAGSLGNMVAQGATAPAAPRPGPQTVRGEAGQQQVQFRLGFRAPALRDRDRYPMTVLNAIMTGDSGRLFEELRNARGLAYVAGSGYAVLTDAAAWFAAAGVDPESLEPALEVVRDEIEGLRAAPPDAGEVAARISQIAGAQILADEGNAARASRLAAQEILGAESTEEFVRRIGEVTPDDVLRVARTYLDLDRALLVVVGPPGLAVPEPQPAPRPPPAPPAQPTPWRGK